MTRILLTNDDGVYAAGLRAAYDALNRLGEVVVSAPAQQKSGVGRSISIFEPLRVSHTKIGGFDANAVGGTPTQSPDVCTPMQQRSFDAHAVGGTPTDAVIIGIFSIMKCLPDLVVSGFNIGENISTDAVTTSGTIGAALEASSYGVPSIAVSIQVIDEGDKFDDLRNYHYDFDEGIKILNRIAKRVLSYGLPSGVDLLNINLPRHATVDTPIEITRLSRKIFNTSVNERHDPRGRPYYWIDGDLILEDDVGTDIHAVFSSGHVSVTPLSLDATSKVNTKELEKYIQ
ncbi:MAG: 5'-nucleotidase SurE1 [Candidatus Argoarchaeum ethanivorans]|uniref:5'-nucleotidase SurE n=2 Tax=Candidatus Argoarchaeum ethanivorans TaxID=2608793 RepID=A0A811T7H8_9EURY|nr:MAG: 5'-nucleotidase SurE1 [Candidatus Argoarchaeum ethanivorans]CAD6493346.1 MAG: 5'-nucleotidase SurE1 [Candidatus Argoarchaeum ethanivorans]